MLAILLLTPSASLSSPPLGALRLNVCSCSAMAPGCGWCSSTGTCAPADRCTTTCRECPTTHKTCRSSCRRQCINTCELAKTVCACSELEGCGWCKHGNRCQPYPECSTTCEECDPKCGTYKRCQKNCYHRFHSPRPGDDDLTWPPSKADQVCAFSIFIATVLASAAGIGGGAVLVPLFTLLGEFTEHEAIPLSIATVFGGSMFSTLGSYMWQKHPLVPHRPVIAYDTALVLLPATLLGSTAGVFFNKLCPNWMIVVLLVALCAFSGKRTLDKAWKQRAKESGSGYKPVAQMDSHGEESVEMIGGDTGSIGGSSKEMMKALEAETAEDAAFPWGALAQLAFTWLCVMALSALKGGHGAPSLLGVTCGSPGYWGVVLFNVPVLTALTYFAGKRLIARHERRVACGYMYATHCFPTSRPEINQSINQPVDLQACSITSSACIITSSACTITSSVATLATHYC